VTTSIAPILLGAILTILTAWCLGRLLLRTLAIEFFRLEEDLFAILSGSACLSAIVFAMCSLHLARKGAFTIVSATVFAVAAWRNVVRPAPKRLPRLPPIWSALFLIPFAIYTVLYFFNALAPEMSLDGSTYHLGSVLRWWQDRGFVRYTGSMYAHLSQGLEMLFLFAFSFGRHSSAALVHFAFLVLLPWLILCYGRRFGRAPAFVLGALLVYLSPVVGIAGTSAYNDLAVACTLFGVFYVLQIWDQSRDEHLLWIAGLLAGFAYALRYTAGLAVLFALGFVGWRLARNGRLLWRPLAIVAGCAAVSIVPWMAKNWLWVGNPFSPFLSSIALFPEIKSRWELPLLVSMGGRYVGGLFGPWPLLTPLSVLALRWKAGRRLLAAAIVFGLPVLANNSTRFLLPFAIFAAPALGLALEHSPGILPLVLLLHSLVSWPDAVKFYADPYVWRLTGMPVEAALRRIPEDQWLGSRSREYGMARAVDSTVPAGARVFNLCGVPQAYTNRLLVGSHESAEGESAYKVLLAAMFPGMQPTSEIVFRLPEQRVRAVRVAPTARKDEVWSVSEMRVYRAGAEAPRQPSWRVTAWPNPWEAPWAFDNSDVTEWSTGRAIEPGMYLEVAFDHELPIDSVALQCTPQGRPGLRLDALCGDGRWRTVAAQPEIARRPVPKGLRRAAEEEMKARGFAYLVASRQDEPGTDMRRSTAYWGMTLLHEVGGLCLYRLD
jgi:hypothetical protein